MQQELVCQGPTSTILLTVSFLTKTLAALKHPEKKVLHDGLMKKL